jgi:1,4-dihydroxy-2-naphthoate octaprenyltransferase
MKQNKILAWCKLARPPFHIVGVLPFILGTYLSLHLQGILDIPISILGGIAVIFIMMATYFAGEYWDIEENSIAFNDHQSKFAGGSRIIQQGILDKKIALYSSIIMLILSGVIGISLVFLFEVGFWAIPLGFIGMIAGFFYSTKPIRWVGTGIGELWIAFCYGWLPVAIGYYLQTNTFHPLVHVISFPIALTIFNVILLNEYPDYHADKTAGKRNIVVRLGTQKASMLYIIIAIGSWITGLLTIPFGVPLTLLVLFVPIMFISIMIIRSVSNKVWMDLNRLEYLLSLNILVNIGTTASFIIAFIG